MSKFFTDHLESAINQIPSNQDLAKIFLLNDSTVQKYIIGKNEQAEMLIRSFKIDGIIDDYEAFRNTWNQVPVIKSKEIPKNSIVVNCSTSISPISVSKNLDKIGVKKLLGLNELIYASNHLLQMPFFQVQMLEDYRNNSSEWINLYNILSDDESKITLLDLVRYRLTANTSYMKEYSVRINQQYFEDFMPLSSEVFVDVGGYDGDTTLEFINRCVDYKKIFFFEPSNQNLSVARSRLGKLNNIEFIQCGLSNSQGQLSFNPNAGSASAVIADGSASIEVSTLDILVKEPVSFIKMDIEGWELNALEGCKNHIINDNPKLAIAVYHNSRDFYEIPNYILAINHHYRLFLRHYTEGWSETVMYFVPLENSIPIL